MAPTTWHSWFTIAAFLVCAAGLAVHLVRLLRRRTPPDFSRPVGKTAPAVVYAFTGAMDPRKKESAFLHFPTYAAGLIYHAGTFVAFFWFIALFVFDSRPGGVWLWASVGMLSLSFLCGIGVLFKRLLSRKLRSLSNPDDYVSNILLTGFHLATLWFLIDPMAAPFYHVWTGGLLLYVPAGKLTHALYFVSARIQAGLFYGRRGVWPGTGTQV